MPQARESNDHSSVRPESNTAKQAGNTQLENEPQAYEQLVLATILTEVQKTNSRLESFEERLEKLEESVHTLSSSSSGAVSDEYKRTVPTRVRVRVSVLIVAILQCMILQSILLQGLVREVYKSLLKDEENFDGFDLKYVCFKW